ncbi:glycosyltransferase [Pseudooceanicola sp.]|uniref:glycosyltransferase n=1 Tax=Pseudooceanicola sp. TaxID=1914328 RepID=UPI00260EEC1D|nr:glycosyltransferase [Pseudooceanicola sp.]MDF1854275.1 glycosyltransferase [Pseudooceanicola sp.]
MKNALLIGFTLPEEIANRIYEIDTLPAVQTTKFAWNFVDSLCTQFSSVRLLSFSPVQSYPRCRKIVFRSFTFSRGKVSGKHLGFVNLLILKHLSRTLQLFLHALPKVQAQRPDVVFIHGVHSPLLFFGAYLARKGYCVIPVLTDPPGVILTTDTFLVRCLKRIDRTIVRQLVLKFSGVIALSDGLAEQLGRGLPKLVFPGIAVKAPTQLLPATTTQEALNNSPEVVYAGTISASYGVRHLVEAAGLSPHIRFSLFGSGDLVGEISAAQLPNVVMHGFLPPNEVQARLKNASLLVNCRPSGDQIAAMSFPSKLIEYALSGVPVLTTRLPSIPANVRSAFIYVDDETGHGFASKIKEVLLTAPSERLAKVEKAQKLILQAYSTQKIGAAIFEFCTNLKRL